MQADLGVPQANSPANLHVVQVVFALKQLLQPGTQAGLEAVDLVFFPREHLTRLGVAADFLVEVLDQQGQAGLEDRPEGDHVVAILGGPLQIGL